MRQVGVGSEGGAEAWAIFHQLMFDERVSGSLNTPSARIKVDEKTVSENAGIGAERISQKNRSLQPRLRPGQPCL